MCKTECNQPFPQELKACGDRKLTVTDKISEKRKDNRIVSKNCKRIAKKNEYVGSFLVFVVLYLTASFNSTVGLIPVPLSAPIWVSVIIWAVLREKNMNRKLMTYYLIAILLYISSSLVNGFALFRVIKYLLSLTAVIVLLNVYPLPMIKRAYLRCILFLSVVSLVMFPLMLISPETFSGFRQGTSTWRVYYNLYLFVHCIGSDRNCGMFWEPGAFAPFILLAIAILILEKDKEIQRRNLKMVVLLITLITTFSTTGYIALAICVTMILFDSKSSRLQKVGILLLVVTVIAIGFYYFSDSIFNARGYTTFGKLYKIFENSNYLDANSNNSSSVRLYSVIRPLEICLNHPFLGVGYVNLQQMTADSTRGAITCTFSNWFGMYGFIYGCMMLGGYLRFARLTGTNTMNRVLLSVLMLLCIATEDFSNNAFFLGIAILGLSMPPRMKEDALQTA